MPDRLLQDKLVGSLRAEDGASAFNATNAAIRRVLAMLGATALVQVRAVRGSGLDPVGMVDVQPMVHQQDGAGRTVPHGLIHNVPYLRLQGGQRALICDPTVGDIGAIIICGRDIASVKATRQPAAPGSYRQHDYADSLYIGGFFKCRPAGIRRLGGGGLCVDHKRPLYCERRTMPDQLCHAGAGGRAGGGRCACRWG